MSLGSFRTSLKQITISLSQLIHIGKNSISAMHTSNYIMRLSMSTSDQKPYTEFWLSLLSFCLWLDGIKLRFKSYLDKKLKERFCNQTVCKSKCRGTKTANKDILILYRFSDKKFSQPIITTSGLPQKQGIQNSSATSTDKIFEKNSSFHVK